MNSLFLAVNLERRNTKKDNDTDKRENMDLITKKAWALPKNVRVEENKKGVDTGDNPFGK